MARPIQTVLTLKDQMSAKLWKIQQTSDSVTKDINKKFTTIGKGFQTVGKKVSMAGQTLTTSLTLPIAGLGAMATSKFAEVDKTMALVNSTMKNSEEEAQLLNDAMKDAAANSTYGMNEAAQAALNFARGGWDATQAANALAPAMNLAAGEGGDLETVSAGLMATMNSFGAEADEAAKYADVFANACNNSALDVNSLASSMSVAAPIFKTSGQDVEDAALAMGVMANAGTDANVAANALKTGIARLASPAKQGEAWMERLGISAFDSSGKLKDMTVLQSELSEKFSTLTSQEKEAAAAAIFGKNQMAPWLSLIQTAPADVQELADKLEATGTASQMADDMMSGFGGSLERIKSSVDVLATSFGEALAPYVSIVAEKVQALVDKFNALTPQQKDMIVRIGLIVAAIGPALMIIGKIISIIGVIITVAGKVITIIKTITSVIGVLNAVILANPIILVITAVIAIIVLLGVYIYRHRDQVKEVIGFIVTSVQDFVAKVKAKVTEIIQAIKDKIKEIKDKILEFKDNAKQIFTEIGEAIVSALMKPFEWISEKIEAFKTGVGNVVDTVKTTAASAKDKVLGHNATGTPYWRGGQTVVGEHGPEVVDLPKGSKVYTNQQSKGMSSAPVINLSLNVQGNIIGNEDYANMLSEKISGALLVAMAN